MGHGDNHRLWTRALPQTAGRGGGRPRAADINTATLADGGSSFGSHSSIRPIRLQRGRVRRAFGRSGQEKAKRTPQLSVLSRTAAEEPAGAPSPSSHLIGWQRGHAGVGEAWSLEPGAWGLELDVQKDRCINETTTQTSPWYRLKS